MGLVFRRNLPQLAMIYGTDKWGAHRYAAHYARHFGHLRQKKIILLEIGIGGWENPQHGGGSLRMWRRYFPNAQIVGLDYYDKSPHEEKRIRIYRGDQSDEKVLQKIVDEVGRPDIIIDDGSHHNRHVLKSFEVLFPQLADDGMYVVEDTQTAYWPDEGGSSDNLLTAPTSMCLLKSLADGLNYEEFIRPGYVPSYHDQHITALHFYHNLVFIQKGRNQEGSNIIINNTKPG
jgi:cephalosporin hydroxylase